MKNLFINVMHIMCIFYFFSCFMFAHSCSHDKLYLHAILWLCVSDNVHVLFLHQMRISSLRINFFFIFLNFRKLNLGNLLEKYMFYVAVKMMYTL